MQRWKHLFWKIVLWHFGLTVGTGLLWNTLFMATESHRSPLMLHATYASIWLFIPFCQPFFWPMSDWVARSSYFGLFHGFWALEVVEYLVIVCLNSLSAISLLFGTVWLVQFARSHPHRQAEN